MPNRPEMTIRYDSLGFRISNKGIMRVIRANKRREAEERDSRTPENKKRSHWRALGFNRESDAARIVCETVNFGNEIANSIREKSGMDDWAPLPQNL